jgi:hypothetical protein
MKIQGQSWSVPMAQEENYNFWDFSTTIFDIKCRFWMKLAPALVPIEAWFWYMLFLDLLSKMHTLCSKHMKLAGEVTSLWPSLRLTAYW